MAVKPLSILLVLLVALLTAIVGFLGYVAFKIITTVNSDMCNLKNQFGAWPLVGGYIANFVPAVNCEIVDVRCGAGKTMTQDGCKDNMYIYEHPESVTCQSGYNKVFGGTADNGIPHWHCQKKGQECPTGQFWDVYHEACVTEGCGDKPIIDLNIQSNIDMYYNKFVSAYGWSPANMAVLMSYIMVASPVRSCIAYKGATGVWGDASLVQYSYDAIPGHVDTTPEPGNGCPTGQTMTQDGCKDNKYIYDYPDSVNCGTGYTKVFGPTADDGISHWHCQANGQQCPTGQFWDVYHAKCVTEGCADKPIVDLDVQSNVDLYYNKFKAAYGWYPANMAVLMSYIMIAAPERSCIKYKNEIGVWGDENLTRYSYDAIPGHSSSGCDATQKQNCVSSYGTWNDSTCTCTYDYNAW